jgi:hypothetical protein
VSFFFQVITITITVTVIVIVTVTRQQLNALETSLIKVISNKTIPGVKSKTKKLAESYSKANLVSIW